MPNKLSQFWQELKRRKVVRVVTVYAGAAFVIIELINNITEPLRLPEWSPTLVIVLLAIGLPIVIILSWIYDVHPGEGMVKTKPASKLESKDIPGSSSGWKIASYISFVVIVGLIVLNIIPRKGKKEFLEKSIAILPFINDSPDQERMYFINGTMEAILDHLSKIEDLRVVSRTSVEQYRNNPRPIPVVAEEMDVSYILEGSGHRDGDNVRLFIQLLDGRKDQHLWANTYNGNIEDIFSMLSEIAQQVAGEIEAIITPEEKALIEKKPTESQTAYDLYIKARQLGSYDPDRAEELCRLSLEYDSAFVWPYITMGWIYLNRYNNTAEYQPAYLDSVGLFTESAILYDPNSAEAYDLRGYYYRMIGENDLAVEAYDRAIELNPNIAPAYSGKAWIAWFLNDMLGAIRNFHRLIMLDRSQLPGNYRTLSQAYFMAGFREQSDYYNGKALELDGDSAMYLLAKGRNESWFNKNPDGERELLERAFRIDPENVEVLNQLGAHFLYEREYEKSLEYFDKYAGRFSDPGKIPSYNKNAMALSYMMNGYTEIADTYFKQQINTLENRLLSGEKNNDYHFNLAQIYALRGEKEKALEHYRAFNRADFMTIYLTDPIGDPFFEKIEDEEEYRQILQDLQEKFQVQHERVRRWLEENDML